MNENSSSDESSEDEELVIRKRKLPTPPQRSTPTPSSNSEDGEVEAQSSTSVAEPEATVGGYSIPTDRTRSSTGVEASEPSSESPAVVIICDYLYNTYYLSRVIHTFVSIFTYLT